MVNRSHTFVARWWFYTSRALSMGPIAPIKLSVHVYGTSITYGQLLLVKTLHHTSATLLHECTCSTSQCKMIIHVFYRSSNKQNQAGQNPTVGCLDAADAVEHFWWSFIHGSMNFQHANSLVDTLYVNPPEVLNSAYWLDAPSFASRDNVVGIRKRPVGGSIGAITLDNRCFVTRENFSIFYSAAKLDTTKSG